MNKYRKKIKLSILSILMIVCIMIGMQIYKQPIDKKSHNKIHQSVPYKTDSIKNTTENRKKKDNKNQNKTQIKYNKNIKFVDKNKLDIKKDNYIQTSMYGSRSIIRKFGLYDENQEFYFNGGASRRVGRASTIKKSNNENYPIEKAIITYIAPVGEIHYSKIDELGRSGAVYASLTIKNIKYGKRKRESITEFRPSGWPEKNNKVKITFKNGKTYNGYFYNRSHLLGHALGGEDALFNLVTGTRTQNVGKNDGDEGMQYSENKVREYFKENPKGTVIYNVRPFYDADQLVPKAVTIDMLSKDKKLNEHIIVYNYTPGYKINYKTGEYKKLKSGTEID